MNGFRGLGIKGELIFPFVIISVLTTMLLGGSCFWKMTNALNEFLDEKSKILTQSLANELGDPLGMGEYDHMQQILESAMHEDTDFQYAVVVLPDGRAIATTDEKLKNALLNTKKFDTEAITVTSFTRVNSPDNSEYFEMRVPVKTRGVQGAVLRVGFTKENAEASTMDALRLIVAIGVGLLVFGIGVYWFLTKRSILNPINAAVSIATKISRGDLGETVTVSRHDEIGQLLQSMNDMVADLREMAQMADAIATGDLSVQVEPRSGADVFGNAFKKMVESLNQQTKELAAREERFRSLCQTSPVGIFETDSKGQTTYANSCWEQMSGLTFDDMAGSAWYTAVHPLDQQEVIKRWELMRTKDASDFSAELRIVRPSGEVCWGHCLSTRLRLEHGDRGYVCTIEDITKRKVSDMAQYGITAILSETKSVEEAAPRILELACHTLDLEAAILWKVDEADGVLRLAHAWYANTAEAESMQDTADDLSCSRSDGLAGLVWTVGRPMWMDRDHLRRNISSNKNLVDANPKIRSAFGCPVQVHHKTIGVMEFYSRASNELNMDLLESYSSVAMQLGQFTERLEAEMSAKQLAAIVECSEDAIISATLGGKILSWNKGAQNLFGYAANEIVGKPIDILLLNKHKDQFFDLVGELLNDIAVEGFETVNVKRDGSLVDVSLTISPIKSETDRIVAMSVIARDITHKKAVEERMREFYAIVSHELRTPLTSIRGALGLISEGVVPANSEEGNELINLAKSSVVRLVRLINDILDLRKIEGGNLELNLQNIDSTELVNKSIDAMRGLAQERGVNLVTDIQASAEVLADSDRAMQVMTNLISNAVKYSKSNSEVRISVSRADDPWRMRFSISDYGPGIPEDSQHKLFGMFQQIDSSDSRAKEGTGLGLAISKAIVEQHGGVIGVNSTTGVGSTFWFELRVKANAESPAKKPEKGNSILVVEDDRELCSVLKVFLNREGYQSEFANTLEQAFERLRTSKPDLILLDVGLPDGSGLEVIERIRASRDPVLAAIPVIVITATERNKREHYGATIVDWLSKPFDYESLRRAMVTAGSSTSGKRVLVVEDDDTTRQVIMKELATLGLTCIPARDGLEAVDKVSQENPDLIILDVRMPRADGFEVIARLRKKSHPPPPVLIYSGQELTKAEKDQLRLGMTRYLIKGSVPREEFLSYVKQMLYNALEPIGVAQRETQIVEGES